MQIHPAVLGQCNQACSGHMRQTLTVSRCSATVDKPAGPRQPLRQNCCQHNPAWGQLSYRRCDPELGPTGTRHWTHETQHIAPLAGKCGNWVLGPDMLCPQALRLTVVWVRELLKNLCSAPGAQPHCLVQEVTGLGISRGKTTGQTTG